MLLVAASSHYLRRRGWLFQKLLILLMFHVSVATGHWRTVCSLALSGGPWGLNLDDKEEQLGLLAPMEMLILFFSLS